jgi:hypothetical protein
MRLNTPVSYPAAWDQLSAEEQEGLRLAFRAYLEAKEADQSPWKHAISVRQLQGLPLPQEKLLCLVDSGCLKQSVDPNVPCLSQRFLTPSETPPNACYVLSRAAFEGLRATGPPKARPRQNKSRRLVPDWDPQRRELRYLGYIVKRFHNPAEDQETILAAFQAQGWPDHIEDPRPNVSNPKENLHNTIKNMNRHRTHKLVRYRGDGTGRGILWEPV